MTSNQGRRTSIPKDDTTSASSVMDLKNLIVESLDGDKGDDIQVINLEGQSALADYIIVVSGTSSRHIVSMAEKLRERLHAHGTQDIRIEGIGQANWVVLDAGDVIVHLFRPEVREFYNIEKMWSVPGVTINAAPKSSGLKAV
ncbi:MAG: ribosome silencing factor [Micavibrio aeruginosavorus]|uniref:Ribosomal silencing factor RsfS n=1 Tax=Micavibrio aeruginosavorus TaxID=349221 RepID=A0A2W4ZTR4_9BACT|nr:MAG: ribosome silencing factor [Micavibrio aeruginosavorus]